jgi:hypothetical protein
MFAAHDAVLLLAHRQVDNRRAWHELAELLASCGTLLLAQRRWRDVDAVRCHLADEQVAIGG